MTDDERGRVLRVARAIEDAIVETGGLDFHAAAEEAIKAMREGEQKREGEARAAGELDALHDLLSGDSSRESVVQAAQRVIKERDAYKWEAQFQRSKREAAESLAKAERALIHTMKIHSGYRDCGRDQMTTPQKELYDSITGDAP